MSFITSLVKLYLNIDGITVFDFLIAERLGETSIMRFLIDFEEKRSLSFDTRIDNAQSKIAKLRTRLMNVMLTRNDQFLWQISVLSTLYSHPIGDVGKITLALKRAV